MVDIHFLVKIFDSPQTSKTKGSFPDKTKEKHYAIDGPCFDSHPIQSKFPEISTGINFDEIWYFFKRVVAVLMNDFIRRQQHVVRVEGASRSMVLGKLQFFGLN